MKERSTVNKFFFSMCIYFSSVVITSVLFLVSLFKGEVGKI